MQALASLPGEKASGVDAHSKSMRRLSPSSWVGILATAAFTSEKAPPTFSTSILTSATLASSSSSVIRSDVGFRSGTMRCLRTDICERR